MTDKVHHPQPISRSAERAIALGRSHALADLQIWPCIYSELVLAIWRRRFDRAAQGIAECERALALDRNLADAHGMIGFAKINIGRSEETEAHINEALRLSPRDTFTFRWLYFCGFANLQLGADREGIAWLRRSIETNRSFPLAHFNLAAALALTGQLDQARAAAQAGLALEPTFTMRRYRLNPSSDHPVFLARRTRICEGMGMAGVPEE
jgi:tetratricopeptide (TPR) repeat protein